MEFKDAERFLVLMKARNKEAKNHGYEITEYAQPSRLSPFLPFR
jgi:hypothetical protein